MEHPRTQSVAAAAAAAAATTGAAASSGAAGKGPATTGSSNPGGGPGASGSGTSGNGSGNAGGAGDGNSGGASSGGAGASGAGGNGSANNRRSNNTTLSKQTSISLGVSSSSSSSSSSSISPSAATVTRGAHHLQPQDQEDSMDLDEDPILPENINMRDYTEILRRNNFLNSTGTITPSINNQNTAENSKNNNIGGGSSSSSSGGPSTDNPTSGDDDEDESAGAMDHNYGEVAVPLPLQASSTAGPQPNTIFKPFDSKTGRFLRGSQNTTTGAAAAAAASAVHTDNQGFNAPVGGAAAVVADYTVREMSPASAMLLSRIRARSHSVPTILHSSLRRLTASNNVFYNRNQGNLATVSDTNNNNSNSHATNINIPNVHASNNNPYSVMKKKSPRSHHQHHYHQKDKHNQQLHHHLYLLPSNTGINSSSVAASNQASDPAYSQPSSSSSSGVSSNDFSGLNNNTTGTTSSSSSSLKQAISFAEQVINTSNNISFVRGKPKRNQAVVLQDRINYMKLDNGPMPLPPINLQCLKEIDLQEIVKNPQLRHDIIFDPLLQFRPNLDGERGIKKRHFTDRYWNDVENEIIVYLERPDLFQYRKTRLVPMFDTLREVLLTIVPQKEFYQIMNVLDTELNVQELIKGSSSMSTLAEWLANLFKHHCAPMRDAWVDKMSLKFREAEAEKSLSKLIDGLKLVFQILEAMKLDIANHQIRLLRPALLSNAVEFEKQYFNSLMSSKKPILKSSLTWFNSKFDEYISSGQVTVADKNNISIPEVYKVDLRSVISLLSCRKMVREYPTSLSFDHARLILLRADIRQLVCLLVCRLLFQQLIANDKNLDAATKAYINSTYSNKRLKTEIVSIITDEHGNCRWTKNTLSIAVYLCKVINDLKVDYENKKTVPGGETKTEDKSRLTSLPALDNQKIAFAKSWLSKQTQPLSDVYGVLENRLFKTLEDGIFNRSACTVDGRVKQDFVYLYSNSNGTGSTGKNAGTVDAKEPGKLPAFKYDDGTAGSGNNRNTGVFAFTEMEEFENIYRHLYTCINLHWSVFGGHYIESLGDKLHGG